MNITELVNKTSEFVRLDQECKRLSYEHVKPRDHDEFLEYMQKLYSLCSDGFSLWIEIRKELGEIVVIDVIDHEIRKNLKNIRDDRDGDNWYVVRQYKSITNLLNSNATKDNDKFPESMEDYVYENFYDLTLKFHDLYDVSQYFVRCTMIGCIIVHHEQNQSINNYYSEIRETYALGLHRSCLALCRVLIEMVLHDELERKGKLKPSSAPNAVRMETGRKYDSPPFTILIREAKRCRILSYRESDIAHKIRKMANGVLHLRDGSASDSLSADIMFKTIRDTVTVVEKALSHHT